MNTLRPARATTLAAPPREARRREAAGALPPRSGRWWQCKEGRRYFALTYALAMLGLVSVFSASFPTAGRPTPTGSDPSFFFRHQLAALIVGLVFMLGLAQLRPRTVARFAGAAMAGSLLLLLAVFHFGETANGALNWLRVGPVRFQPAEVTKFCYIVFMAAMLARGSRAGENWKRLALMVGVSGVLVIVLIKQRDLGMALLICGIALGLALLSGMKLRYWMLLLAGVGALGLAAARMEPYRWARVVTWWDLPHHRGGVGYHVYGMLISLARGGVLGSGLGMSRDKWTTLPVPHTDSIFCVIGGELGLWGTLGVLALMTLLGVWAFDIARRSPHRLGWFLAAGSGLALTLQAYINIAVATAAIPVTGLTLPFISFGGTSLIACLASAGLVLAVASERTDRVEG